MRTVAALTLACLLVPACGPRPAATRPVPISPREYFPLRLPAAIESESVHPEAWADPGLRVLPTGPREGPRWLFNVSAEGRLWFKTLELDLGDAAHPASPAARAEVGDQVRWALERDLLAGPAGARPPLLQFAVDRTATWAAVQTALAGTRGTPLERLEVQVLTPGRPWLRRSVYALHALPEGEASAPDVVLQGAPGTPLRLAVAGHEITCEPGLDVRAAYDRLRGALGDAEGHTRWRVRAAPDVPWERVVQVLDALRGGSAADVSLDGVPWLLTPIPHAPDRPWDPTPDEPVSLWLGIALALACALVAWLSFPGAGTRRAR